MNVLDYVGQGFSLAFLAGKKPKCLPCMRNISAKIAKKI